MGETDYSEPTQGSIPVEPTQPREPYDPEVSEERRDLVKKFLKRIRAYEGKYERRFKQMREDMKLTRKGASKDWGADQYTANLIQRHVKQRVSSLYAKNPTVKAKRRKTMDYMQWDGNIEAAKVAGQMVAAVTNGEILPSPQIAAQLEAASALMQDIMQGRERQKMIDGIGETLEICFSYYMKEGQPPFKLRAKQLVRRAVVCSVGYVKLGYQRMMGRTPDWNAKMADASDQLAHLQRLADEATNGEKVFDGSAELEEMRLMVETMSKEPEVILREGLIFDFPRSYDIIPIGDCVELKGFVGCDAVAQRMMFQPDKIEEIYGKDIKKEYTAHTRSGNRAGVNGEDDWCVVYEYYDKATGLMYTLADGYCDFLEEPAPPPATVEQFFPFFVLSFNDIEDEDDIFPPSDPELLRSQQMEYNRAREALRTHRIANQPNYVAPAGAFPDWTDEHKLMSAIPHEILKLNALATGQKVGDVIQPIQKVQIDPALYDTEFVFQDILRTVGSQEANIGGLSGATATEASIGENSRMTAQSSEIDDMDDMLSQLARAGGQILLKELSADTAKKIAGPGAKWPELSALEIAEELYLDIEAGSSGKPNKGMELANWERLLPLMLQIPGISPTWLGKESIKRMDDHADLTEAILDGAPSIMAMNQIEKAASTDPNQQGVHGGNNAEQPPGAAGGPQAQMGADGRVSQPTQTSAPQGAPQQYGGPAGPQPMQGQPQGMPQQPAAPPIVDANGMPMQPQEGVPMTQVGAPDQAMSGMEALQTIQPPPAMPPMQQGDVQMAGAVAASGQEAVAAIQQAAADAVAAIQGATGNAVAQITASASAEGLKALVQKMNQPSPLDALLADRLTRMPP